MRLDEWQRYIDSQFLDDEPSPSSTQTSDPTPQDRPGYAPFPPASPLIGIDEDGFDSKSEFETEFQKEFQEEFIAEIDTDTVFVSEPEFRSDARSDSTTNLESRFDEPLTPHHTDSHGVNDTRSVPSTTARSESKSRTTRQTPVTPTFVETAENSVQNILTLLVTPPVPPTIDTPRRPPIVELLTPLPEISSEIPAHQNSLGESHHNSAAPAVVNRTRRRSHITGPQTEIAPPPQGRVPNAHPSDSQTTTVPLVGQSTEIPEFASYLPISYGKSQPGNGAHRPPSAPIDASPFTAKDWADADESLQMASTTAPQPGAEIGLSADQRNNHLASQETIQQINQQNHQQALHPVQDRPRIPRSRARHARNVRPETVPSGLSASELWAKVPRHVQTLLSLERLEEEEVAQSSYKRPFQEKRHELIERLLDPILSLEDTARLLNVCPTTVRRYTNKGILTCCRKEPERSSKQQGDEGTGREKETRQRRFRLSDILAFLETQQAAIEADRKAEHEAEVRAEQRRQNRVKNRNQPGTTGPL